MQRGPQDRWMSRDSITEENPEFCQLKSLMGIAWQFFVPHNSLLTSTAVFHANTLENIAWNKKNA